MKPHLSGVDELTMNRLLTSNPRINEEMIYTGSYLSKHKLGIAFDCTIDGYSADQVRQEILDNEDDFMEAGLTTLESGEYAPT